MLIDRLVFVEIFEPIFNIYSIFLASFFCFVHCCSALALSLIFLRKNTFFEEPLTLQAADVSLAFNLFCYLQSTSREIEHDYL